MDFLNEALISGISPLELTYKPVCYKGRVEPFFGYRTVLRINSQDLGVLLPRQYSVVADRDIRGVKLASWVILKAVDCIKTLEIKNQRTEFLSVAIPNKMLLSGACFKTLKEEFDKSKFSGNGLVLEFSCDILFEDAETLQNLFYELKTLNVKLAITEFGSGYCPTLKLKDIPVDYIILDSSVSLQISSGDTVIAENVISLAKKLNVKVIADDLPENGKNAADKLGIDYYCSTLVPLAFPSADKER